jgi:MFS family permease
VRPSEAPPSRRDRLPRAYVVWLSGVLASMLGDAVLYFALGWTASAHGGSVAALVLTAINLPRALLLLIGGAVGDRFGVRKIMLIGDSTMIALTVLLALVAFRWGAKTWLLITAGLLIGAVDAFYLPASGSMPRRPPLGLCAGAVTLTGLGGLCSTHLRRTTAHVEAPVVTGAAAGGSGR